MANKRVIDLPDLSQDVQEGQYILVDSSGGTGRMNLKHIVDEAGSFDPAGEYPDLYAGNLTTDKTQTDSVPYLFRPTGGGLQRIGERCYPVIIGASVVENQLVQNGDFSDGLTGWSVSGATSAVSDGKVALTATGANIYFYQTIANKITGRKVLVKLYVKSSRSTDMSVFWGEQLKGSIAIGTSESEISFVATTGGGNNNLNFGIGTEAGDIITLSQINLIDLTAMFGSTIADYVYSLETATAGAGVAKLREWGFLSGYQAYNAGAIESVEATGRKCVGFNQWDEETRNGYYSTDGSFFPNASYTACKNLIPVLPSTLYNISCDKKNIGRLCFYNSAESFISTITGISSVSSYEFTIPVNAAYMSFDMTGAYGTTYNHDICINLSNPDRNGEYEPYKSTTYSLGSDVLRGIFKLDANNKLYADGDRKEADGTITRLYPEITLDGSELGWAKSSSYPGSFYLNFSVAGIRPFAPYSYCLVDELVSVVDTSDYATGCVYCENSSINFWYPNKENTTLSAFKSWLATNPIHIVYKLATPTTEQSTSFTSPQVCYPDGTEQFVTENGVPVGHETSYPYDLKGLVEGLIDVPDVPSVNGTYVLKATRSASGIVYNWVTG